MKNLLLFVWFLFVGCLNRVDKIEYEQGVVVGSYKKEGYWNEYTTYEDIISYSNYNGRKNIIRVPRTHRYYVEPVYSTTFKCQHQKLFKVGGIEIYKRLREFDTVTIEYYNLVNGDKEIKDYEFITAYKQKNNGTF